jgi:hypothetical protein
VAKVTFLKRAVIAAPDGQLIFGQVGQQADIDGEVLQKAISAGDVELSDAPARAKSKK